MIGLILKLLVFIGIFLLITLISRSQSIDKCFDKGVEYAIRGKFKKANKKFKKVLKVDFDHFHQVATFHQGYPPNLGFLHHHQVQTV